jgi:pilus assembly protein FimV
MKRLLTPRKALAALAASMGASTLALSVGALQGATVVGRPLEVRANVSFDAREAQAACLGAEVYYGEYRVPRDQVQVSLRQREGGEATVHVASARPVDEPFVTVVVSAGCSANAVTRRFVLLAEAPGEPAAALAAAALPAATRVAGAGAVQGQGLAASRAPGLRTADLSTQAARPAPRSGPARDADKPRKERIAAASAAGASRLRLDVAAPGAWQSPWLRVSTEMKAAPAADATQRAAAALLWQAINAQPHDLLRMGDRIRSLETELASLQAMSLKHRSDIASMRDEVRSAPGGGSPWTLAGAIAVLAALTAAFLAWRRGDARRADAAPEWFGDANGPRTDLDALEAAAQPVRAFAASVPPHADPAMAPPLLTERFEPGEAPPDTQPSPFLLDMDDSPATRIAKPAPKRPSGGELQVTALADTLQEAGFLVSIGFPERAIDVLRTHLEGATRPSPLAWLELLHLCRELDDAEGVHEAEASFRRLYGEEPPRPESTTGLEACEPALTRVMAAWPAREVLDVIEDLLFSPPEALGGYASLHAWRDLMWLYEVAQDTLRGAAQAGSRPDFADSGAEMTLEGLQGIDLSRAAPGFALDFDLTDVPVERHKVVDRQNEPRIVAPPPPAPEPKPTPTSYEDFFEATAAAEGRGLYIRQ